MNKGKIDPIFSNNNYSNVAVLDAELLVDIKSSFLGLKKSIVFGDYGRKVLRYVSRKLYQGNFDGIIVCAIKNKKLYKEVVENYMEFQFQYLTFTSENSYKMWLKMRLPKAHFAIKERQYYHKQSMWLSKEVLNIDQ